MLTSGLRGQGLLMEGCSMQHHAARRSTTGVPPLKHKPAVNHGPARHDEHLLSCDKSLSRYHLCSAIFTSLRKFSGGFVIAAPPGPFRARGCKSQTSQLLGQRSALCYCMTGTVGVGGLESQCGIAKGNSKSLQEIKGWMGGCRQIEFFRKAASSSSSS